MIIPIITAVIFMTGTVSGIALGAVCATEHRMPEQN